MRARRFHFDASTGLVVMKAICWLGLAALLCLLPQVSIPGCLYTGTRCLLKLDTVAIHSCAAAPRMKLRIRMQNDSGRMVFWNNVGPGSRVLLLPEIFGQLENQAACSRTVLF